MGDDLEYTDELTLGKSIVSQLVESAADFAGLSRFQGNRRMENRGRCQAELVGNGCFVFKFLAVREGECGCELSSQSPR